MRTRSGGARRICSLASAPFTASRTRKPWASSNVEYSAIGNVVSQWSIIDPAAAASWVSQFSPGELRDVAMRDVVGSWSRIDPANAGRWLASLPADASRDAAYLTYAEEVAQRRPDIAARSVESIGNLAERMKAIQSVASQWLKVDRPAALAWLRSVGARDLIPTLDNGG